MFLKAPHRITAYKNCMDCRLPPEPVMKRRGTWLEAALFYSENFSKFKKLVSNIEDDTQSVQKVKSILSTNENFVFAHFNILIAHFLDFSCTKIRSLIIYHEWPQGSQATCGSLTQD